MQTAATIAGGLATAAYLDAKYLIRNDLKTGSASLNLRKSGDFVAQEFSQGRGLIYHYFEAHALGANSNNIFLIFEGREWTYKQFYDEVQLVGNWLLNDLGIQKGEIVAVDGPNSPQYVMFILALSSIGAAASYINSNLTATPLPTSPPITPLPRSPPISIPPSPPPPSPCLIYTSGTTGLPKAVKLPYARELASASSVSNYLHLRPGVRMYTCLPLYHVSGHNLCTIPSIYAGSTVVLSPKFSHATFWPEIRSSKAQIVQHVGELIRYVLNAPPSPRDREHNVQMVWGNGIRPDVWEPSGSGSGSSILRGKDGWGVEARDGEVGETVYRVEKAMEGQAFAKYFGNEEAGLKRRVRGLFEEGDCWFRSGDLMRQDEEGRLFFVDRLGDTFRWRSENIRADRRGQCIRSHGPKRGWTGGLRSVVPADGAVLDMKALAKHALENLPRYAVPLFLRIMKEMEYTGTNKMQKGRLKAEGIDVAKIHAGETTDLLYWLPPGRDEYMPYGSRDWESIQSGKVKL
ncbi:Fatty acid transporter protein [Cyphellophora attinorum]|uniref:Fatty acid transporter protein n=1 Tax=Cyphellophora attinorum TaxID=1664694 RepID=A0A0N0NKM8_9EURO|nr:Fatty acid transporter protein [Phialophora attinorum]KPI38331.1 Fatty acid transporter protein [Phialophora attinorum]